MLEHARPGLHVLVGLVLVGLISACGVVADPVDLAVEGTAWPGEPTVTASSGTLELPGFNDHIDAARPSWATSPREVAAAALHLGRSDEDRGRVEVRVRQRFTAEPVVRVTFTGLPDDSTAAVRYELTLRRGDDGLFRFVEGTAAQRCRDGRGRSGGFSARPCA